MCALQLSLAPRFERELAPQPRDPLLSERTVEGAIERMQRLPRIGRVRRFPRWSRWAAAALLVFGVTAAAAVIRRRTTPRPAARISASSRRITGGGRADPPVEPPPAEAPVMLEAPPPKPAPAAHSAAHPTITADALFERAEKLRREGRADAAIAIYRRLQATFPETAEAQLSFALAGQLLLERGRPGDALAQFDRHLSPRRARTGWRGSARRSSDRARAVTPHVRRDRGVEELAGALSAISVRGDGRARVSIS